MTSIVNHFILYAFLDSMLMDSDHENYRNIKRNRIV